jgi:hypothetical protein
MPRRAPDQVQEMRITFGNYEREFVTEVKNDVEKTVKVAAIQCNGLESPFNCYRYQGRVDWD